MKPSHSMHTAQPIVLFALREKARERATACAVMLIDFTRSHGREANLLVANRKTTRVHDTDQEASSCGTGFSYGDTVLAQMLRVNTLSG